MVMLSGSGTFGGSVRSRAGVSSRSGTELAVDRVAVAGALLLLGFSALTAASRAPSARGPAAGIALSDTRGGDAGASDALSRRAPTDMAETTVAVAMACGTPRIALVCHADLVFSAGDDVALNSTSIRYYPVAENGPPSKLAP